MFKKQYIHVNDRSQRNTQETVCPNPIPTQIPARNLCNSASQMRIMRRKLWRLSQLKTYMEIEFESLLLLLGVLARAVT